MNTTAVSEAAALIPEFLCFNKTEPASARLPKQLEVFELLFAAYVRTKE